MDEEMGTVGYLETGDGRKIELADDEMIVTRAELGDIEVEAVARFLLWLRDTRPEVGIQWAALHEEYERQRAT